MLSTFKDKLEHQRGCSVYITLPTSFYSWSFILTQNKLLIFWTSGRCRWVRYRLVNKSITWTSSECDPGLLLLLSNFYHLWDHSTINTAILCKAPVHWFWSSADWNYNIKLRMVSGCIRDNVFKNNYKG